MEQPPQNYSCFVNGSDGTLEAVGLRVAIGGLAVVTCGIVMVLIVCLKAYKTFIDRLVLYITISAFLFSVSTVIQMVSLMKYKIIKDIVYNGVCHAVGYMHTFTVWMLTLFLLAISLYLILRVAFQVELSKYEVAIVITVPIISAAIATIPFATRSYGSSVAWCWIKSREKDDHDQNNAGFVEQMVLGYTLQIVATGFDLFVAVYVGWVICRHRGARRQHMEAVKETIHLVLYPIINELLCLAGLANRIDHFVLNDPYCHQTLWWLAAAFTPLKGIVITLALLFHVILIEYRKRNRKRQRQRNEDVATRYIVPSEFTLSSEVEPLVITGVQPPESVPMYDSIFDSKRSTGDQ